MNNLKQWWDNKNTRDQRIYQMIIAIVLVAATYAWIWVPAQQGRTRLHDVLSIKLGQLQLMQAQANQINSLKSMSHAVQTNPKQLQSAVQAALKLHGLISKLTKLAIQKNALQVHLNGVGMHAWLDWVNAMQAEQHIFVQRCHIESSNMAGLVNVQATFFAQ